jgi:hypothetical protein
MFFNRISNLKKFDPSIKLYLCQSIQQSISKIFTLEKDKKNYKIANPFNTEKTNDKKDVNIILYGFSFFSLYLFFHIFFHKKNMYKYI